MKVDGNSLNWQVLWKKGISPSSFCDLRKLKAESRSRSRGRNGLLCVYNYATDPKASEEYNMWGMLRRSEEHNQHDGQC